MSKRNRSNRHAVVVGGGLTGIAAAILLSKRGLNVHLVEREKELGGLLRSNVSRSGLAFDLGTHFALSSGIEEVDEALVNHLDADHWRVFTKSLREGHIFKGHFYQHSGCIDTRRLDQNHWREAVGQIITTTLAPPRNDFATAAEELVGTFGRRITQEVFRPVLRKLTGKELEELAPGTHKIWHLNRLILFDTETASALKAVPDLDSRIAYTSYRDGESETRKYYPRRGGIQRWIDTLVQRLPPTVAINTESKVARIGGKPKARIVTLDDGATFEEGEVVWTLPPALFLRAIGQEFSGAPPPMRDLALIDLVFDCPFGSDLHWISNYDVSSPAYRVTLYPNMIGGPQRPGMHHCTVEVYLDAGGSPPPVDEVVCELKRFGIVSPDATQIDTAVRTVPRAIPLTTVDAAINAGSALDLAQASCPDVCFVGPPSIGVPGMISILRDLHAKVNRRWGEPTR